MITRRQFLKLGAAGSALLLINEIKGIKQVFALPLPGGTLDLGNVNKFVTPLVIPPAMPRTRRIRVSGEPNYDYYEIAIRQFEQQILPAGFPKTTVWSYGSANHPGTFNYPAFTIEADFNRKTRIKWINQLVDGNGNYLPHLLPVDPTLHWANPPGGESGRDTHPHFQPGDVPVPYTGPVPMVTHVHGAEGVGDESDGYAEAWYLPDANNIPDGYATVGTWYDEFARQFKAERSVGDASDDWTPGSATFEYPNTQRAGTIWYHDHSLGMTRLNVYAGPAGFYIIRGGSGDNIRDTAQRTRAVLPGPAPQLDDAPGTTYYEIPLAIQDRSFNSDGSLFYPDTREFFDGLAGSYIPDGPFAPIWNPEFFGNTIVVNGNTWPKLDVEPRRYRFRLLNGCQSRFLILKFDNPVDVWQIGNEGGFLAEPVDMNAANNGMILMGPAERADIIVDFSTVPFGTSVTMLNLGPDEPFGGGTPGVDFDPADPDTTGMVMRFNVINPLVGADDTTHPRDMRMPAIDQLSGGTPRRLALIEEMGMGVDGNGAPAEGPIAALLGTIDADGYEVPLTWMAPITENPNVGDTEVWEFYNLTGDGHPMHIHEQFFQVVNREKLVTDINGEPVLPVQLSGDVRPPEAWENGWKDTVIAYPGEVTRLRIQFNTPGLFVWHCHIVEHEDNEMMRPYAVGPIPLPGPTPDPNGNIQIGHRHNEAILTYINVGGNTGEERIKPASGLDAIVGQWLTIDAVGGVTEVGGGEGYGVNAPGQNNSDRKTIDGNEELRFVLNSAALNTATQSVAMFEMDCKFRMGTGGSAEVIATAYYNNVRIGTLKQTVSVSNPNSNFSDVYRLGFGRPFDTIVFTAGAGSSYSIARPIVINTVTSSDPGPTPTPGPEPSVREPNGNIQVSHGHNQAILNYTDVGGNSGQERISPASGLDAIVGQWLTIDAINGVTEVGGGEGYGVKAPGQNNADRKTIDGYEELRFILNTAALNSGSQNVVIDDLSCKFRMERGGSAEVIAVAYRDGAEVGTLTQVVSTTGPSSNVSDTYTFRFDKTFDTIAFKAGNNNAFSIVRNIMINTITF